MKFQIVAGLVLVGLVLVSAAAEKMDKKEKRGVADFGYGQETAGTSGVEHGKHGGAKVYTYLHQVFHIPIPKPYPVTVEKKVPVPYPVAVKVPVEKPVPVPVIKPYPVPVEKMVPYPVHKDVPVPVQVPVEVPYPVEVRVPVAKPYPVHVVKNVPYIVRTPVYVEKRVPVYIKEHHQDEGIAGSYTGAGYGGQEHDLSHYHH